MWQLGVSPVVIPAVSSVVTSVVATPVASPAVIPAMSSAATPVVDFITTWLTHSAWQGAIVAIPVLLMTKAISNWSPRSQDRVLFVLLLATLILPIITAVQHDLSARSGASAGVLDGFLDEIGTESSAHRLSDGGSSPLESGGHESGNLESGSRQSGIDEPNADRSGVDGSHFGETKDESNQQPGPIRRAFSGTLSWAFSGILSVLASMGTVWLSWLTPIFPALTLAWVVGIVVGAVRLVLGYRAVARLIREAEPASAEIMQCVDKIRQVQGLRRTVKVRVSRRIDVPMVVGLFSPSLLLPKSVQIDPSLPAVLHHEIAHLKRKDPLRSAILLFAELFYLHVPPIWILSRKLRILREYCCDAVALEHTNDPIAYARALADLESRRSGESSWAFAINGTSLKSRVRWMLEEKPTESASRRFASIVLASGAVLTMAMAASSAPDINAEAPGTHAEAPKLHAEAPDTHGDNDPQIHEPVGAETSDAERALLPAEVRAAYDVAGWTRDDFYRETDQALESGDDLRAIDLFWMAGPEPWPSSRSSRAKTQRGLRLSEAADRRYRAAMPVPDNFSTLCAPLFRGVMSMRTASDKENGTVATRSSKSVAPADSAESMASPEPILSFHFDSDLGSEITFDGVELEIAPELQFSRADGPHGRRTQWLFYDDNVEPTEAPYLIFFRDGPRYLYIWDTDRDGEADWVRGDFIDFNTKAPAPTQTATEARLSDGSVPDGPAAEKSAPPPKMSLAAQKRTPEDIRSSYETDGWTWHDFQSAIDEALASDNDVGVIDYAWMGGTFPPDDNGFSEEWIDRLYSISETIHRRYEEAFTPPANIEILYPFGWGENPGTSFGGSSRTDSTETYFVSPGTAENAQVHIGYEPYLLTVDFDLDGEIDLRFDGVEAEVASNLRYLHETGPFGRRSQWLISDWNVDPRDEPFFLLYRDGPSWMFLLASDREEVVGCGRSHFVSTPQREKE